jgi:hypothetical protein
MRTAVMKERPQELCQRKIGKGWKATEDEARDQILAYEPGLPDA